MEEEKIRYGLKNDYMFRAAMQSNEKVLRGLVCALLDLRMDEIKENSLWIYCPVCGGKTRTKVCKETVLVKFPLYCPKCKKEVLIDVVQLKIVVSE